jgi:hypothetical protein
MVKHTHPKSGIYFVVLPYGTIRSHTADSDSPLVVVGVVMDDVWFRFFFVIMAVGVETKVSSAARAKEMSEYQLSIPKSNKIKVASTGPVPPAAAIPNAVYDRSICGIYIYVNNNREKKREGVSEDIRVLHLTLYVCTYQWVTFRGDINRPIHWQWRSVPTLILLHGVAWVWLTLWWIGQGIYCVSWMVLPIAIWLVMRRRMIWHGPM